MLRQGKILALHRHGARNEIFLSNKRLVRDCRGTRVIRLFIELLAILLRDFPRRGLALLRLSVRLHRLRLGLHLAAHDSEAAHIPRRVPGKGRTNEMSNEQSIGDQNKTNKLHSPALDSDVGD